MVDLLKNLDCSIEETKTSYNTGDLYVLIPLHGNTSEMLQCPHDLLHATPSYGKDGDLYCSLVMKSKLNYKVEKCLLSAQTQNRDSSLADLCTPHISYLC